MKSMLVGRRLLRPAGALAAHARLASPLRAMPHRLACGDMSGARGMCGDAPTEGAGKKELDYSFEGLAFEGGKDLMVRRLKMASVLNLGFAAASAPVLQYITSLSGNGARRRPACLPSLGMRSQTASPAPIAMAFSGGKGVAMSATLVMFGGTLTGMLTWISGTYVLRIKTLSGACLPHPPLPAARLPARRGSTTAAQLSPAPSTTSHFVL